MLTFQRLLRQTKDKAARKRLLAGKVEDMINTVVRQIAFYDFECKLHAARAEGESKLDQTVVFEFLVGLYDKWLGRIIPTRFALFGTVGAMGVVVQLGALWVLLKLIADEPRHGYDLIKAIEEMTGGDYAPSPGAVYPTLQLLEDEGSIEEAQAEGAKKPFAATAQGLEELEDRKDEVKELMRRLGRHAERTTTVRSHDVFRAMGNLGSVLKNRAKAGKLDEAGS